ARDIERVDVSTTGATSGVSPWLNSLPVSADEPLSVLSTASVVVEQPAIVMSPIAATVSTVDRIFMFPSFLLKKSSALI
ncbi:MAG: hypothetical protein ACI9QQ_003065, partial [Myxococcota bacterium]